ncbi:hypothetical protein ACOMHN_045421 [Nucella lapillus]
MKRTRLLVVAIFLALAIVVYFTLTAPPALKRAGHSPAPQPTTPMPRWKVEALTGAGSVRTVDANNVSALVEMGREIHRQHGAVLFCMINDAYFDFAASWCCNTEPLGLHSGVLFLTTDVRTGQLLKTLWPNVSVVALSTPQFNGYRNYSKVGHVRMMTERTRFLLKLLEAGVRVLLFEVDCLWLKNPLSEILPRHKEGDILGTRVAGKDVTAAGFLLLNPTPTTVKFWLRLTQKLDHLVSTLKTSRNTAAVAESKNEQEYFTALANNKFSGINIVHLSEDVFPDGKWYTWPEKKRKESRPILINNNWVVGSEGKRRRAKAFGHWFWDERNGVCNTTAIHRLFPS